MPGVQREGRVLVDDIVPGVAEPGTIADGVDNTILATVHDYPNSNPVAVQLTDSQGLPVSDKVSVLNSTTTPMLAGAFFNGTFERALGYSAIVVVANSDAQAVVDQIYFEFSTDGVNVDYFLVGNYRDTPGIGFSETIPILAPFFRIRWQTQQNQTWFRLTTIFKFGLADYKMLTHVELPTPDNVVVMGANRGNDGPGLGISSITLWDRAKFDIGPGASQWGLFVRSQPGVLDRSQFLEQASGDYPIGAAFYNSIPDLADQQSGVLRCTPKRELYVSERGTSLTASAPAQVVSIVAASVQIVAANANRKGLRIQNVGSANRVSLAFGANAAVLDFGMTLLTGGVFNMDAFDYTTAAVNAISVSGGGAVAIQEYT